MLPRETFFLVGCDLLTTGVVASASAAASAASPDIPRLLVWMGWSSAVTVLLSTCGIDTLPSVLRYSALVAPLDGRLLSKFRCAAVELPRMHAANCFCLFFSFL